MPPGDAGIATYDTAKAAALTEPAPKMGHLLPLDAEYDPTKG